MNCINIKAVARIKITKLDEHGKVIGVEEQIKELTDKEAEALCHLHQQA